MKKEYGNKIKAIGLYLYQTSAQIAIKTFQISVQFKFLYRSQQVIRRVIKHWGSHTIRSLNPSRFLTVYQRLERPVVHISGSKYQAVGKISHKSVTQGNTIR